jgi:uncharacterized protein
MGGISTKKALTELRRLKKHVSIDIEKMLLFGSRARGDELLQSDVDVIVVSKDFVGIPFRDRPDAFLDSWRLPVDLEVLCYSPDELERKMSEYGLVREAMKEAVSI